MTKTKTQPAIEERLELARRLRLEQFARGGGDVHSHPDAAGVDPALLDELAADAREARRRPPRNPRDVGRARLHREKRRGQLRRQAARGALPKGRTDELAYIFSDEELRDLLLADAEAREAKAARNAQLREGREVAALAGQIEREREREARQAAEAEARERLGVKV